jgi:subtilisin family serine protease
MKYGVWVLFACALATIIDAPGAWEEASAGCDAAIAVIDDPIDTTHPDLAANVWVTPGETAGNGVSPSLPGSSCFCGVAKNTRGAAERA